jgi:hypothetical protein
MKLKDSFRELLLPLLKRLRLKNKLAGPAGKREPDYFAIALLILWLLVFLLIKHVHLTVHK